MKVFAVKYNTNIKSNSANLNTNIKTPYLTQSLKADKISFTSKIIEPKIVYDGTTKLLRETINPKYLEGLNFLDKKRQPVMGMVDNLNEVFNKFGESKASLENFLFEKGILKDKSSEIGISGNSINVVGNISEFGEKNCLSFYKELGKPGCEDIIINAKNNNFSLTQIKLAEDNMMVSLDYKTKQNEYLKNQIPHISSSSTLISQIYHGQKTENFVAYRICPEADLSPEKFFEDSPKLKKIFLGKINLNKILKKALKCPNSSSYSPEYKLIEGLKVSKNANVITLIKEDIKGHNSVDMALRLYQNQDGIYNSSIMIGKGKDLKDFLLDI